MQMATTTRIMMISVAVPITASPAVTQASPTQKSSLSTHGPSGITSPSQLVLTLVSLVLISLKSVTGKVLFGVTTGAIISSSTGAPVCGM